MTATQCQDPRVALRAIERVVVKVGSAIITEDGRLAPSALERLARDVAALRDCGQDVIMVVSGAVAAGYQAMGLDAPPTEIVARQAAASVGQHRLIAAASARFAMHGIEVAQLLLSAEDVENRRRFLSARHTLRALLERGVIPIINENDALADDESKVGDNDHLAALVASLVSAELLVIFSNVAGVQRDGGNGSVVSCAEDADALHEHVHTGTSTTGVGGMAAKIDQFASVLGYRYVDAVVLREDLVIGARS